MEGDGEKGGNRSFAVVPEERQCSYPAKGGKKLEVERRRREKKKKKKKENEERPFFLIIRRRKWPRSSRVPGKHSSAQTRKIT